MADERPQYQHGTGTIGGQTFHWGSGQPGAYWSIPYGDYPVTPNAPTGDWAHRVGAIPIANNVIPDSQLGRNRIGIMIHSGSSDSLDKLYTQGCFKVAPSEWPAVRQEILKEASAGPLYLHVQPGGQASFTNASTLQPAGSIPTAGSSAPAVSSQPANLQNRGTSSQAPIASQQGGNAGHEQFIRDYAAKVGVNPDVAVGVANAEGLRAWSPSNPNAGSYVDRSGGQPFSFGDFQLNVRNGLGTQALKAGIDPRDPNQWQAADQYAIDQMKAGGLGPWKGDKFAANYRGPVLGTSLATTPPGVVDPSIVARGGTSPPLDASGGTAIAAAPAAPSFGDAAAKGDIGGMIKAALTKPPPTKDAQGNTVEGKSPLQKLAGAVGDVAQKPAPEVAAMQPAMPAQDPDPGLAPASSQLFQTVQQAAMRPLTWSSRPYGWNAGQQLGTTLNATGYGNG